MIPKHAYYGNASRTKQRMMWFIGRLFKQWRTTCDWCGRSCWVRNNWPIESGVCRYCPTVQHTEQIPIGTGPLPKKGVVKYEDGEEEVLV